MQKQREKSSISEREPPIADLVSSGPDSSASIKTGKSPALAPMPSPQVSSRHIGGSSGTAPSTRNSGISIPEIPSFSELKKMKKTKAQNDIQFPPLPPVVQTRRQSNEDVKKHEKEDGQPLRRSAENEAEKSGPLNISAQDLVIPPYRPPPKKGGDKSQSSKGKLAKGTPPSQSSALSESPPFGSTPKRQVLTEEMQAAKARQSLSKPVEQLAWMPESASNSLSRASQQRMMSMRNSISSRRSSAARSRLTQLRMSSQFGNSGEFTPLSRSPAGSVHRPSLHEEVSAKTGIPVENIEITSLRIAKADTENLQVTIVERPSLLKLDSNSPRQTQLSPAEKLFPTMHNVLLPIISQPAIPTMLTVSEFKEMSNAEMEEEDDAIPEEPMVDDITRFSWEEIAKHNKDGDLWMVVDEHVYDLSKLKHTGGQAIIKKFAGKDGSKSFKGFKHSKRAYGVMDDMEIGMIAWDNKHSELPSISEKPKKEAAPEVKAESKSSFPAPIIEEKSSAVKVQDTSKSEDLKNPFTIPVFVPVSWPYYAPKKAETLQKAVTAPASSAVSKTNSLYPASGLFAPPASTGTSSLYPNTGPFAPPSVSSATPIGAPAETKKKNTSYLPRESVNTFIPSFITSANSMINNPAAPSPASSSTTAPVQAPSSIWGPPPSTTTTKTEQPKKRLY
jgi:cytochrome b involved in lipid metabolism